MTLHDVIHHLPTEPPVEMQTWAKSMVSVGEDYMLFQRERVPVALPTDDDAIEPTYVYRWGAKCTCTCCGETFETGWESNPRAQMRGIRINLEENGWWPGYVEPGHENAVAVREWETINCPYCECGVRLLHTSDMGDGHTYQIMLVNVGSIGPYAVIYAWLYRRTVYKNGRDEVNFRPAYAYVVSPLGSLHKYSHVKSTGYGTTSDRPQWERSTKVGEDPFLTLYYSYGAINHSQCGGQLWPHIPSLAGTTAEKTGLEEYLLHDGHFPIAYLQEWRKHPYIENLMKSDFGAQCAEDIDMQIDHHLGYCRRSGRVHIEWANLKEAKPHRQLGMTKQEVTALSGIWGVDMLELWARYHYAYAKMSATAFEEHRATIGNSALHKLVAYADNVADECWTHKAARYVAKQEDHERAAEMLCDLWDMLDAREAEGETIPPREWWPRELEATHDRESARKKAKRDEKIDLAFARVAEKYAALEWNDGELCIRLPRSNGELEREGETLCHCVGCYGTRHTEEKAVVFFVRHHRRPERSYYTMDYSFGDRKGYRRNQLHGYGNERHGEHKQHSHSIPKKVTAFVERWEREVLAPWVAAQMAAQHKPEKKSA